MASGRVLSFAFLAVVVAFIGSTLWSQRANKRASDAALAISTQQQRSVWYHTKYFSIT